MAAESSRICETSGRVTLSGCIFQGRVFRSFYSGTSSSSPSTTFWTGPRTSSWPISQCLSKHELVDITWRKSQNLADKFRCWDKTDDSGENEEYSDLSDSGTTSWSCSEKINAVKKSSECYCTGIKCFRLIYDPNSRDYPLQAVKYGSYSWASLLPAHGMASAGNVSSMVPTPGLGSSSFARADPSAGIPQD